ncbi:DUF3429 domain-containing protein [Qipengyuania qiaonensis]|uniref:DUF3429 domain-containing protein n=1 Tax=Qipengyuania qiaonensis TaxID=2867240 RepID=A0ABS7J644_9SPHN|nr:DUF3429 domain-containing protein [Qipengyuania qiaonensis]MBX7482798.1 DUF3429 domain-containing protein [Qipengyuania qiaonensis]
MGSVPTLPRWLGLAGLLPQLACVVILYVGPPEWRQSAQAISLAYAALILSFLGGTWWGFAAMAPAAERRRALGWLWVAAVLPCLAGLACFFPAIFGWESPEPSLVMLAGALLVSLGVDARLGPLAPRWWMSLRAPLSIGLGLLTMAAALA